MPAKSIVLTPRTCWKEVLTAALGAAATLARDAALSAETKVRLCTVGAANWRAIWREARAAGLEAIVNMCEGYLGEN